MPPSFCTQPRGATPTLHAKYHEAEPTDGMGNDVHGPIIVDSDYSNDRLQYNSRTLVCRGYVYVTTVYRSTTDCRTANSTSTVCTLTDCGTIACSMVIENLTDCSTNNRTTDCRVTICRSICYRGASDCTTTTRTPASSRTTIRSTDK